ncbi:hypothetical protein DDB_G0276183 [Dictyostelium discoideum AX4]|uniref:Uncharacterized protein n=1 Tax=Dictyostelium discoideum TaxID=44689 RepID=Q552C2_DICDI|nr:hypothetical protein DDB_G0276183 [Dictyostelium discoideum AX4]EAL69391.1 hypothetical protein DDB_G0276183 [Dictyostelium discoideum AX4]|eukprot:XP_643306.1 hypothetical protein DDB_G0276183 [Dictyostelium discoideum AX4]
MENQESNNSSLNIPSVNLTPFPNKNFKNVFTTPLNNNNNNNKNNTNIFTTPIPNSPFQYCLTPVTENKKMFGVDSNDVLPMPNSSNVNKNVHSPPKPTLTLIELRLICEKNFLNISIGHINGIIQSTNYRKKRVTQWFIDEWFEGNKEINVNIVLRTVFSVFCSLRKENRIDEIICTNFQLFWNKLKRETTNKKSNRKNKKMVTQIKNNFENFNTHIDISDSFMTFLQ